MLDASAMSVGRPVNPLLRAAELRIWGQAEDALRGAQENADHVRAASRAAFAQERERGRNEGLAAGAEEAARVVAAASAAAEALLRRIEADLPGIVHGIVEGVLGAFPVAELVGPAVRHALGWVRLGASATLRVSPGDAETLRAALADRPDGGALVRLEPDPTLEPGRHVLGGEFGAVELGVAAQLRALRDALAAPADGAEP